jgi:Protein of unknown function (DUF3106)
LSSGRISRPLLFAAACLLAVPVIAGAQTGKPIPLQSAQSTSPASSGQQQAPLSWSDLSPTQQSVLGPLRGDWGKLHPNRQHKLAEHARQWANLPAGQQQQIRERLTSWAAMTPAQRTQLRENARVFHSLPPDEQARLRQAFRYYQSLPPAQRKALRARWQAMPAQQRMHWLANHPGHPIPMHPPSSAGHP